MAIKMTLNREDEDFEQWDVAIRGDAVRHDVVVSCDVGAGTLVTRVTDGNGIPLESGETTTRQSEHLMIVRRPQQPEPGPVPDAQVVSEAAPAPVASVEEAAAAAPSVEDETVTEHSADDNRRVRNR